MKMYSIINTVEDEAVIINEVKANFHKKETAQTRLLEMAAANDFEGKLCLAQVDGFHNPGDILHNRQFYPMITFVRLEIDGVAKPVMQ